MNVVRMILRLYIFNAVFHRFTHKSLYHTKPPTPQEKKKKKKSKLVKRAAEVRVKAQESGEGISMAQPSKGERIPSRPAKRRRPSSSQHGGADEGVKVVGTTGTLKLPNKPFACTKVRWYTCFSCCLAAGKTFARSKRTYRRVVCKN